MRVPVILVGLFLVTCPASAKSLDAEAINNAQFGASSASKKAISPLWIKAEILLARAHFSSVSSRVPTIQWVSFGLV